jgi:hypothetical protein
MDCKEGIWRLKSEARIPNSERFGAHRPFFRFRAYSGFWVSAFGFAPPFVERKALLAACPEAFLI